MRSAVVIALSLAVFAAFLLFQPSPWIPSAESQPPTDEPGNREAVEVLDCRNSSFTCKEAIIEKKPESCQNWAPWSPYDQLNCSHTRENLKSVSFVTDPANYVELPRTDLNYQVNFFSRTGKMPWDLEFLPSGTAIWTTRPGKLKYREDGNITTVSSLNAVSYGAAGLMGLAVHPQFEENSYIYLYYTYKITNRTPTGSNRPISLNRISRFKLSENNISGEKVLLEVPGGKYHSGGRLEFGPDGKLYATSGDANIGYRAPERSFLGGKIIRLNPDGSIPENNPFSGSPVYSMGHRNPQGLTWKPPENTLLISEHGTWRKDEINRIQPGESYGWPGYICNQKTASFGDYRSKYKESPSIHYGSKGPVYCFKNWTLAPSGATFVDNPGHPWHGDLFVAGLRGKQIFRLNFRDRKPAKGEIFYVSKDLQKVSLRFRDVEFFNGSLYAVGARKGIARISPEG